MFFLTFDGDGDQPKEHLARAEEGGEGEGEEAGEEVVGLEVEQVVHHPVHPLLRIAQVRNLKPEKND